MKSPNPGTQSPKRKLSILVVCLGLAVLGLAVAQSASAATTSGIISANETWSGTVTLTGDVTVPANVTLTILPGTQIAAYDNYDDVAGGTNSNRIELIVNGGRLTSIGTSNNPIRFTSSPLAPPSKRGDWYGIRFLNSTNTSTFRWCVVEFGTSGVSVESGNVPTIDNCTFRHQLQSGFYDAIPVPLNDCLFSSNGIACEASSLVLTNCTLQDNGAAILAIGGTITIVDSIVSRNNGYGVMARDGSVTALRTRFTDLGAAVLAANPTLVDCQLTTCDSGVFAFDDGVLRVERCNISNCGSGVNARFAVITDTTILDTEYSAIITGTFGGGSASLLVSNCVIRGGSATAIRHGGENATILNSVISYNNGEAIYTAMPIVRGCSIDHNTIGLRLAAPTGTTASGIVSNRITANTAYEVQNDGPGAVLITNNFWGEPTTTELANNERNLTKVYDSQDNASVGQVLLKPYLAADPFAVPPKITSQPSDMTVAAGANATFTVTATSASAITYQWRKGSSNLSGQTNSFLSFTAQISDAATNYNVIVSNGDGAVTSRLATLTVLVPPSIATQPTNRLSTLGSTTSFHVTASGSAPLYYQWHHVNTPLASGGRINGATSANLTIANLTPADAGNYWVRVTNSVGMATSSEATLTLPTPPLITTQPGTQVTTIGGQAVYRVQVSGSQPMAYQWYRDGHAITGGTDATLTIPSATIGDLGFYVVAITNGAGGVISQAAALWLNDLKMYAGVNVYGPVGGSVKVDYTTNLAEPYTWLPLQGLTIATNPTVIIDFGSSDQAKRFYRTVPVP